jgi:hypothetical protein
VKNQNSVTEIFSGTQWEAGMIESLLQNAEIQSFLRNTIGTAYGFNPNYAGEVKVMVSSEDFEIASQIVNEYRDNLKRKSDE